MVDHSRCHFEEGTGDGEMGVIKETRSACTINRGGTGDLTAMKSNGGSCHCPEHQRNGV